MYNSIEEAIESLKDEDEIFIIGGAQIYKQALKYATKLYITEVDGFFPDADAYFPDIDKTQWKEIYREENKPDKNHKYGYNYTTLLKIF
jgi:dihydrofolate reductase